MRPFLLSADHSDKKPREQKTRSHPGWVDGSCTTNIYHAGTGTQELFLEISQGRSIRSAKNRGVRMGLSDWPKLYLRGALVIVPGRFRHGRPACRLGRLSYAFHAGPPDVGDVGLNRVVVFVLPEIDCSDVESHARLYRNPAIGSNVGVSGKKFEFGPLWRTTGK